MNFQTASGKDSMCTPSLLECFKHSVGIIGFEQRMDFANVVGECCQEQRAVADAFGTGQGNGGRLECRSGQADGFGHGWTKLV